MSTITHCCLDLEGFLSNASYPSSYRGMFKHDDGRPMTPAEARAELFNQLRLGRRMIPLGPQCDAFDYQTGCKGHQSSEECATDAVPSTRSVKP